MQLLVDKTFNGRLTDVNISHGESSKLWNVEMFNRSKFQNLELLFANLNGYLNTLPIESQDQMWMLYTEIFQIFDTVNDTMRLHQLLQAKIAQLYLLVSFEDLKRWVRLYGTICAPDDLKIDHQAIDSKMTQRLTYLKEDYYDLVVFSILLKLMVPVFGEAIRRIGKEVRSNFKEHYVFSLLSKSQLVSLPPFFRLRDYVEATTLNEERKDPAGYRKASAVFGGLGTSELPDWLLSKVIIRRVAIHEELTGDNVIANVYHAIDQQMFSLDKTFGGRVNKKELYNGSVEEDNASVVENYKVKQEITNGDLCILSVYMDDYLTAIAHVDPTYNPELLQICYANMEQNKHLSIGKHHITLTQWVMAKAIPPRGIPSLNKQSLLKALTITQALLWHWGFVELAALMFSEVTESTGLKSLIPPSRLVKKTVDDLAVMYPHYQLSTANSANTRTMNIAVKAINLMATELTQNDWVFLSPPSLLELIGVSDVNRAYSVSAEIRQQIAELIFKIYSLRRT